MVGSSGRWIHTKRLETGDGVELTAVRNGRKNAPSSECECASPKTATTKEKGVRRMLALQVAGWADFHTKLEISTPGSRPYI
jgi:hypothetical protein